KFINFYGNYKVYHRLPAKANWPERKTVIHRNLPEMYVWGDGSNVRLDGSVSPPGNTDTEFVCHHFGFVRNPARLREKWRNLQGNMHNAKQKWFKLPSFVFNWCPHNWLDPQFLPDLAVHEAPHIQAVRGNPDEFVRDRFQVYDYLSNWERKRPPTPERRP